MCYLSDFSGNLKEFEKEPFGHFPSYKIVWCKFKEFTRQNLQCKVYTVNFTSQLLFFVIQILIQTLLVAIINEQT